MSRKWVVNASPLILLSNIACVSLLESLCSELVIPAAVADEIHAGPTRDAAQRWLENEGQGLVHRLEGPDAIIAAWDLGAGESEVLTWARRNPEFEAILDDRAARTCAASLHIPVRGTLGIVLLAKREGLISRVRPVLQQLLDVGLRISPQVFKAALKLAGEG